MSLLGQKRKSSIRANVFRFAPRNGHGATAAACRFRAMLLRVSAAASRFNATRKVRGRFWMKRYGPSRRRAQNASAALKIFVRHPKKTFATISANSGHSQIRWNSDVCFSPARARRLNRRTRRRAPRKFRKPSNKVATGGHISRPHLISSDIAGRFAGNLLRP